MARSTNRNMITATFTDRDSADRAYEVVEKREGYSRDDVNVLMSEEAKEKHFGEDIEIEKGTKAAEGASIGSAVGGAAGGVAGALTAAAGTLALPGLGIVLAGPLAAALAGLGAGGASGGIIGALIGAGIPEERAKRYKKDLKEGHIVLGVEPRTREDADYFVEQWRDIGGERIYTGDATSGTRSATDAPTHSRDDVETTTESRRRDEPTRTREGSRAREETRPREERHIRNENRTGAHSEPETQARTDREHRTRSESGTESTSRGNIGTPMGTDERHAGTRSGKGTFSDYEDDFRSHHASMYGNNADYATHESAYRFGHEMAQVDRFQDRPYTEIEPDLRGRYEERYPNSNWNNVRDAVKYAFAEQRSRARTN